MARGEEKGGNPTHENERPIPRKDEEMPERTDPIGRGEEDEFEEIDDVDIDEFEDDEDEGDY